MFGNFTTRCYLWLIEKRGFKHGKNFNIEKGANIDRAFCRIISCGDNVTLAKDVYVLAHDASMNKFLGKTKVGSVRIGNNVFIGAKSIILPGVTIGDKVVVAASSCISHDIPSGEVWGGVPAKKIMDIDEFLYKHREQIKEDSGLFKYID